MIVELKSLEELKRDFIVSLRNNCGDKVTKVTPTSLLNGFAYGTAKIVQKINRDAALVETKLFPEYADTTLLDDISKREGISDRTSASKSSTVLLFIADSGTVYPVDTEVRSASGVIVKILSELTIDDNGFGFVMAESLSTGANQIVDMNTITVMVATPPSGHISVYNPVRTIGGADAESDWDFRRRIMNYDDILSKNTDSFYTALVRNTNDNVLRVRAKSLGRVDNRFELILVKNSGADFSSGDRATIKSAIQDYIPYSDYGSNTMDVVSITWTDIDMYVPVKLDGTVLLAEVLKQMQIVVLNYLDMSKWKFGAKVDWEVLLNLCRNITGVSDIDDSLFVPHGDIQVADDSLPKLRDFTIKDVVTDTIIGRTDTPIIWLYQEEKRYNVKYMVD